MTKLAPVLFIVGPLAFTSAATLTGYSNVCMDREGKWEIDGKSKEWCDWASSKKDKSQQRCEEKQLQEDCPVTCNNCPSTPTVSTPAPVSSPVSYDGEVNEKNLPLMVSIIDINVNNMGNKVDTIDTKVSNMQSKIGTIDTNVIDMQSRVEAMESRVESIDMKIDALLDFLMPPTPSTPSMPSPVYTTPAPAPAPAPISLESGNSHSCVIDGLKDLWCWGWNFRGQLGMGDTDQRSSPTKVPLQTKVSAISLGQFHTCMVDVLAKLWCWGQNNFGQLGLGNTGGVDILSPNQVALVNDVAQLFVGYHHTCIIDVVSKVFCMGRNDFGQLGLNNKDEVFTPTEVTTNGATQIVFGAGHMCLLDVLSKLWCVGYNNYGQLGLDDDIDRDSLTQVSLGNRYAVQVAAGLLHTCILDDLSNLWCWGWNVYGQLGVGDNTNRYTPTPVGLQNVSQLSLSRGHTCIINDSSDLYCFGHNDMGQVGIGTEDVAIYNPTLINLANGAAQISLGLYSSCAVDNNNSIYCWGRNNVGQLGLGDALEAGYKRLPTFVIDFL